MCHFVASLFRIFKTVSFYFFIVVSFLSCNNSANIKVENQTAKIDADSSGKFSDSITSSSTFQNNKKAKTLNKITAAINEKKFSSISYTINRFEIKSDTVYAFYATNGIERIIINYRGPSISGVYNLVENADAIYMDSSNTLFNAKDGVIGFESFDLNKNIIKGWFYFNAQSSNNSKKSITIKEGRLIDVEFFSSTKPVNNSIQ